MLDTPSSSRPDADLREYLAGADNCRQPRTADDRNPSFEQRASSCHLGRDPEAEVGGSTFSVAFSADDDVL